MPAKIYVYSTLTSDMDYTLYDTSGDGDLPLELPPVRIKGGAGVANDRLVTPSGVATEITEEQAEQLRQNKVFQLHEKNGFVRIDSEKLDPEHVAADMASRDKSAPIVPQDMPEAEQPIEHQVKAGRRNK